MIPTSSIHIQKKSILNHGSVTESQNVKKNLTAATS